MILAHIVCLHLFYHNGCVYVGKMKVKKTCLFPLIHVSKQPKLWWMIIFKAPDKSEY